MNREYCQRPPTANAPPPIPSRAHRREVRSGRATSHKKVLPILACRSKSFPRIRIAVAGLDCLLMARLIPLRGSRHDHGFTNGASEACARRRTLCAARSSRHVMQTGGGVWG